MTGFFLCPCIEKQPIPPQLERIEGLLERCKVVGLKIFLSYQAGKANDARMYPIYAFAAQHQLSVTFHTGLCSLVLPSDQDIEGSSARYIARAAEDFPQVNFIAAHMDDPNFEECIRIVAEHDNIYTDFPALMRRAPKRLRISARPSPCLTGRSVPGHGKKCCLKCCTAPISARPSIWRSWRNTMKASNASSLRKSLRPSTMKTACGLSRGLKIISPCKKASLL